MMRCEHVGKVFRSGFMGGGAVTALEDVSFSVAEGTTYALCGLSGSGWDSSPQRAAPCITGTNLLPIG